MNVMIEGVIAKGCCDAVAELYGAEIRPEDIGIERTRKEFRGDFTVVVFPLTKISRKSPEVTATEIGAWLREHIHEAESFEVIKGFLNLTLAENYWISFLCNNRLHERYGFRQPTHGAPVVVEYSSPNTNKPLHLGHIRNNLIGYALSRILKANGHHVVKVNLVNDRGIHICKSMLAYSKWGNGETPESSGIKGDHLVGRYYVLFDQHYKEEIRELMERGLTEEEAMRQAPLIMEAQEMLQKWEANDPDVRALWKTMNDWTYHGFDATYRNLGVDFDHLYYESKTYLLGKEMVSEGLEKGVFKEKQDGSIWVDLSDEGLDEKLLLRSDGTSVYITQDLGTAELRYHDFKPGSLIYVVGNEQNYHFEVLVKVLKKLGKPYSEMIHHLSYGMVELPFGKMKSREGTVVDADDLMDEMFRTAEETTRELGKANDFPQEEAEELFRQIGLGALKYFILKVDPKKNMLFDPRESIDFNGNTGPFIQYTHARIRSLLRKAADAGYHLRSVQDHPDFPLQPQERILLRDLYQYPAIVSQAGEELNPALVANYLYELARDYNQFYQEIPVLREENRRIVVFRLLLSEMVSHVLKSGMYLLGIDVPDRM